VRDGVEDAVHVLHRLAHGQPAEGDAVEGHRGDVLQVGAAEVFVDAALHDAEERLPLGPRRAQTPRGPGVGAAHRGLDGGPVGVAGRALVEHHGDVAAEQTLHADALLGGEPPRAAVEVRAKRHALVVNLAQARERKHLKASGVGEHRPRPPGETMQPAEGVHHLGARPQPQVVGVAQDDARARGGDLLHRERFHRAEGAHGHEGGRLHRAVGRLEQAHARGAVAVGGGEGETWGDEGGHGEAPLLPRR
jgi:hypothetical protein